MKKALRRLANRILNPLGFSLVRTSEQSFSEIKIRNFASEIEGCFAEMIFPDVKPRAGRTELIGRLIGVSAGEAMYLVKFLQDSLALEGDVCEFGVAQGATSALIANEIAGISKSLWLFDSFQGLPKPTSKDRLIDDMYQLGAMEKYEGTMSCRQELVKERLAAVGFPPSRARIVPGFIEETVAKAELPARICFAFIDFDLYLPILTTLKAFDGRLSAGGAFMVDDYGFFSSGVESAVTEFLAERPGYELILPRGFAGKFCILRKK